MRALWVSDDELVVMTGWYERGVGCLLITAALFAILPSAGALRANAMAAVGLLLGSAILPGGLHLVLSTDERVFRRGKRSCERTVRSFGVWPTSEESAFDAVACIRVGKLGHWWVPSGYRVRLCRQAMDAHADPGWPVASEGRPVIDVARFVLREEAEVVAIEIAQLTGVRLVRSSEETLF